MAQLSPVRAAVPLLDGLTLLHRGKVRDTYEIDENRLLVVATDGISIFDVVLNAMIPEKGMILTAMSHYWFKMLGGLGVWNHMIAAGADIDAYLPPHLHRNTDLQSRAMVVHRLAMYPVEFVVRGYLTGSGFGEYKKTGTVCGHQLPEGLQDGDKLPDVILAPTTKAEDGHDQALDAAMIREKYPYESQQCIDIFEIMSSFAEDQGIIIADSKFEFGAVLADEIGTPDSSRFWDQSAWLETRKKESGRKAPPPFDKQLVRAYGIEQGIDLLDPRIPKDVAVAHGHVVPKDLIRLTTRTFRYIFWRMFGVTIEEYMNRALGVPLRRKKKRVAIVFGSESDIPPVSGILDSINQNGIAQGFYDAPRFYIISCHRNPMMLDFFIATGCEGADVVIAVGSKAFALPGDLDARLYGNAREIPVIGVALGAPGSQELKAAQLAIEELPGQHVIMDEVHGKVFKAPTIG